MEFDLTKNTNLEFITNKLFLKNVLKRYVQLVVLDILSSDNFFNGFVFYGGTCLSLFYGDPRLSEDLDFQFFNKTDFKLEVEGEKIRNVFLEKGFKICTFNVKDKKESNVITANISLNVLEMIDKLKVKTPLAKFFIPNETIRVDIDLNKENIKGFSAKLIKGRNGKNIFIMDKESILACKISSILERDSFRKNIKGRDFFDYMFLLESKTRVNKTYLLNQLNRKKQVYSTTLEIKNDLLKIFKSIDEKKLQKDLLPFLEDHKILKRLTDQNLSNSINDLLFEGEQFGNQEDFEM